MELALLELNLMRGSAIEGRKMSMVACHGLLDVMIQMWPSCRTQGKNPDTRWLDFPRSKIDHRDV